MFAGKTASGFEFKVDEKNLYDYELVELLSEVDQNPLLLPRLLKQLLGEEQKNRLIEHIREKEGSVPLNAMNEEIAEIFKGSQALKNS